MKMSFRWYGEGDPISLQYISQIPGMRSVVSAIYDVKPGEVWGEDSLAKMKKQVEDAGLVFDIVESVPVHENIKLGKEDADKLIDVYCENIRRCAKYGVKCITYNFMPVFDWLRSELERVQADGASALAYDEQEDLISIGTIGLIKAIDSFDVDKGIRLATYAARCVENAILSLRRTNMVTISP